jgi:hypothetical protein
MTSHTPQTESSQTIRAWNLVFAGLFLVLALWTLVADLRLQAHFLLQDSLSTLFLGMFITGWMFLSVIFAGLPKRFVLPAVAIATCRMAFGWPILYALDLRSACLIFDGLLVALGALYLAMSVMDRALGKRAALRWQHSLAMGTTALLATIVSLPVGYFGLAEVVTTISNGYVRLSTGGIDLTERIFEKAGRRVHLVGMAHIGDREFYETLNQSFAKPVDGRRLVLLEGVADSEQILPESFASGKLYRSFAGNLGLVEQTVGFEAQAEPGKATASRKAWVKAGVDFRRADIDISELSPAHRDRLVLLLTSLEDNELTSQLTLPEGITAVDFEDLMVEGLLKQRNTRLMEVFAETEVNYAEVFIPWGAAHLPDLQNRLTKLGYKEVGEHRRRVLDFRKLLRLS